MPAGCTGAGAVTIQQGEAILPGLAGIKGEKVGDPPWDVGDPPWDVCAPPGAEGSPRGQILTLLSFREPAARRVPRADR